MRSCEIELGNMIEAEEFGETTKSWIFRTVFAKKKSIRSAEFYDAKNVGLKPELTFDVYSFEFDNDEKLRFEGKVYTILRTYEKGEHTELTVSSQVGAVV